MIISTFRSSNILHNPQLSYPIYLHVLVSVVKSSQSINQIYNNEFMFRVLNGWLESILQQVNRVVVLILFCNKSSS